MGFCTSPAAIRAPEAGALRPIRVAHQDTRFTAAKGRGYPTVRELRRMSVEQRRSLLRMPPATQLSSGKIPFASFLALTLLLPTTIVIGNCVLGALTPITDGVEDDMSRLDGVWRLVQGQHLGIDFHDPLGFGFFQVAAVLWHLLGPHHYILWAATALFAIIIVCCGCVVAARQLRHTAGLAALFCMTIAFVASGPSIYGFSHYFSFCLSYDRLFMSGLLVLFVQSFANDLDARRERGYIDHLIAALLKNDPAGKDIRFDRWRCNCIRWVNFAASVFAKSREHLGDILPASRYGGDRFCPHKKQPLPDHAGICDGCSRQSGSHIGCRHFTVRYAISGCVGDFVDGTLRHLAAI